MIDLQTATIGVFAGCLLVSLGLVPGLFQGLVQGVAAAIQEFEDRHLFQRSWTMPRSVGYDNPQRPIWLAGFGAGLIVLCVLAVVTG